VHQFLRVAGNAIGMRFQSIEPGDSFGRRNDEPPALALHFQGCIRAENVVQQLIDVFAKLRGGDSSGHDRSPRLEVIPSAY
jgi:hypothetical protein